jgi:hypothetical protein
VKLEEITGSVHGGKLSGFGEIDIDNLDDWKLQVKMNGASLELLLRNTEMAGKGTGAVSAFVDLHGPVRGTDTPLGAGWFDLVKSQVWELPVFSSSLEALGVEATESDQLQSARVRFRVDHGYCYLREMIAVGSPVNLYGKGSVKLDGSEVDVELIPRVVGGIAELPVVGTPTELLLSVIRGAAVVIKVHGTVGAPQVSTQPLPVITKPIEAFFSLVDSGK